MCFIILFFYYIFVSNNKNFFKMEHKYEIPPVKIPAGTVLPIQIWVWNVGQWPIVTVSTASGGGTTTYTPLVVPTSYRDPDNNLVQYVSIDPAPGESGTTTENYEVNVYPQNFL